MTLAAPMERIGSTGEAVKALRRGASGLTTKEQHARYAPHLTILEYGAESPN
jgi:hypothetical protein